VLGLAPVDGGLLPAPTAKGEHLRLPGHRPVVPSQRRHETSETVLVPPGMAHVFDSCIRDPRNLKSASADLNVHTNLRLARAAQLEGCTLNGMALLCLVLPGVLRAAATEARFLLARDLPLHVSPALVGLVRCCVFWSTRCSTV
jgi:hypothetical protein